jgi:uncharacterized membrane protein
MEKLHAIRSVGTTLEEPVVRTIGLTDLIVALARGIDDFRAMPTHAFFIAAIYPVLGLVLAGLILDLDLLPFLIPLLYGFALVGPFAAIGLYELSRCREAGETFGWARFTALLRSPALGSIAALGLLLLVIFVLWLAWAQALYEAVLGPRAPSSLGALVQEVLTTRHGWALLLLGNLTGLFFCAVVFAIGVISFPMLLDRDVSAATAVRTSIRAVTANPTIMGLWGLIVAGALIAGFIPFLLGLAVVLPILGHATWHLYRRVVAP